MAQWRESFRALNHRDFRLYTAGQIVSLTGSWMQSVAQSWLIYRLTHSEFMMGAVMFATHIPVLLLGPLGGMAADRFPRQRIVLITQTLALLQALLLAVLNLTGTITPNIVLVLAVLLGAANAFDIPGRQTLFIQMVGKQDLISAISLNSAVFNASRVVGPSLAGLIVAAFGETVCFAVNAASFIAMIVCVAAMRLPQTGAASTHAAGGFRDGLRYAWQHRELRVLLAISGLTGLCYAPILALAPFFADGIFHQGSAGLGFLVGAMGVGAVIGVVRLARRSQADDRQWTWLQVLRGRHAQPGRGAGSHPALSRHLPRRC
ncbi:MAG: MFS transporter, partial [Bryobacterales bacterium]|nr:MFS transporter [Bryobacterales bacterium]